MEVGTSNWEEETRVNSFDDEEGLTEDDDYANDSGPWYEDWDEEEDEIDDDDDYDESYLDPDIF